jgi:hypothetical protein
MDLSTPLIMELHVFPDFERPGFSIGTYCKAFGYFSNNIPLGVMGNQCIIQSPTPPGYKVDRVKGFMRKICHGDFQCSFWFRSGNADKDQAKCEYRDKDYE